MKMLAPLLLLLALIAPLPATAFHHSSPVVETPTPEPTVASVSNPCTLGPLFLNLHAEIIRLGFEAMDEANTARALHHTSLSKPYKHIEEEWLDIKDNTEPLLDSLSDIPLSVDLAPNSTTKRATLALSSAYQNAVEQIISTSSSSLYYEHTENFTSMYNYRKGYLNFGTQTEFFRAPPDSVARNQIEGKLMLAQETLMSLRLPEHRFGKLCHITFSTPTIPEPKL